MKFLTFIFLVVIFSRTLASLPIFRPVADDEGFVSLFIPAGGMIIQPLTAINNSETGDNFTFMVKGQASRIGDSLVFMYRVTNKGEESVYLTLPTSFFYHAICDTTVLSIDISSVDRWVVRFMWDGERYVHIQECSSDIPSPSPAPTPTPPAALNKIFSNKRF